MGLNWTEKDLKDMGFREVNGQWRKVAAPSTKKKGTASKKTGLPTKITAQQYREYMSHLPNQDWTGREKEYIEKCFEELKIDFCKEFFFAKPDRDWRFDFAVPIRKFAIEYEGLMAKKSRHTTITGYTGDTEKYNAAGARGWRVFRYTALNYKQCYEDLKLEFGL